MKGSKNYASECADADEILHIVYYYYIVYLNRSFTFLFIHPEVH